MPVNDLLELATHLVDEETTELQEAQSTLADAQARALAARQGITAEIQSIEPIEREIPSLRRQIADAPTPADAAAALQALTSKLAELRLRRSRVAEHERIAAEAAADVRAAGLRIDAAGVRLSDQQALLAEVNETGRRRDEIWSVALAAPPLDGAAQAAEDLVDQLDDVVTALTAKVPEALLNTVLGRYAARRERLRASAALVEASEDGADRAEEKYAGIAAEGAKEERAYHRTRAAVADFVVQTPAVLERGAAFAAEPPPELSNEQREELNDGARLSEREASAGLEDTLRLAQIDELTTLVARRSAEMRTLVQPSHDASAAIAAHEAAVSAREQADLAFTDDDRERVFAWQAAAPDPFWSYLARLDAIRARLTEVENTNVGALLGDLADADRKLARALEKSDEKHRKGLRIDVWLDEARLRGHALLDGPAVRNV